MDHSYAASLLIKAYPPSHPRAPVRAASSGVTSVHVGVRPRLHPSHSAVSIGRNQPNFDLPLPMFSPAPHAPTLPREDEMLRKAQEQYDLWLSKKQEREGGVGDDGWGTRSWTPKDRVVARPSALQVEQGDAHPRPPNVSTRDTRDRGHTGRSVVSEVQTFTRASAPPSAASSMGSGSENEPRATTPTDSAQQWYDPYAAMWQGYYPYDPAMWQQYGWDQEWQQGIGQSDAADGK